MPGETESGSAGGQPGEGYPGPGRVHDARRSSVVTPGAALSIANSTLTLMERPGKCLKKRTPDQHQNLVLALDV